MDFKIILLQNHWVNYNQTWRKVSLGERDSSLFSWRARPFQRGEIIINLRKYIDEF